MRLSASSASVCGSITATSKVLAVLAPGVTYRLACSVPAWIALGDDPTAAACEDGSHFVAAGEAVEIVCHLGAKLAIVRHRTSGAASVSAVG